MQNNQPTNQNGADFYQPDYYGQDTQTGMSVDWQASEYVHNSKGIGWAIVTIFVSLAITGVAIWIQQWTFAILTIIMAVAFGFYAFRKPQEVQYHLSDNGIKIGDKEYSFDNFKSFGVMPEGAFYSAQFMPNKRFSLAITIHFSQNESDQIFDIVGAHLPIEETYPDVVEILMRKLRF